MSFQEVFTVRHLKAMGDVWYQELFDNFILVIESRPFQEHGSIMMFRKHNEAHCTLVEVFAVHYVDEEPRFKPKNSLLFNPAGTQVRVQEHTKTLVLAFPKVAHPRCAQKGMVVVLRFNHFKHKWQWQVLVSELGNAKSFDRCFGTDIVFPAVGDRFAVKSSNPDFWSVFGILKDGSIVRIFDLSPKLTRDGRVKNRVFQHLHRNFAMIAETDPLTLDDSDLVAAELLPEEFQAPVRVRVRDCRDEHTKRLGIRGGVPVNHWAGYSVGEEGVVDDVNYAEISCGSIQGSRITVKVNFDNNRRGCCWLPADFFEVLPNASLHAGPGCK